MADTNEKVILRVEIDQSEAVQRSAQLSKEIKDLTMANKELAKAGKDTSAEYQENVRLTKMLKDEKAQLDRQIDLSIKAFSAESGSINQLRAEVSFLTMKYNDLSESERDNSETGKQLQASIKAKTDRLKELEGAVGDNRRSVGDYRGALRDVVGEMRIDTNELSALYPIAKANNDSKGFRDNFRTIKDNLDIAAAEIIELQNRIIPEPVPPYVS